MAKEVPIDEYIQIYNEFHVLSWSASEIAKKHQCSDDKVWDALTYVDSNILKLPQKALLRGAIFSIRERLKINKEEIKKIQIKDDNKNYPVIIGFNREIRADEQLLYSLMGLLNSERGSNNLKKDTFNENTTEIEAPGLTAHFLKVLRDEHLNGETNLNEVIRKLEERGEEIWEERKKNRPF